MSLKNRRLLSNMHHSLQLSIIVICHSLSSDFVKVRASVSVCSFPDTCGKKRRGNAWLREIEEEKLNDIQNIM
jgi:hypothetical protein